MLNYCFEHYSGQFICLPVWHVIPVKPSSQLQVNESIPSVQVPPFWQGLGSHSSLSVNSKWFNFRLNNFISQDCTISPIFKIISYQINRYDVTLFTHNRCCCPNENADNDPTLVHYSKRILSYKTIMAAFHVAKIEMIVHCTCSYIHMHLAMPKVYIMSDKRVLNYQCSI